MLIGYALCGSFCTVSQSIREMERLLSDGHDIVPIMSENVYTTDTRFGDAQDISDRIVGMCGRQIIHTIERAEPFGPKIKLDLLIIAPCTGNTLAKLAHGITDTAVTMAAKAHSRQDRPILLALASNDAMSANLANIGTMTNKKGVYFVPMEQDDPKKKPHSLVAKFEMLKECAAAAVEGRQIYPLFL